MVNSIIGMEKNGKIYIPKEIRENYGTKFFIVPYRDKIIPYDIPENPIEDLIRLGEKLTPLFIYSAAKIYILLFSWQMAITSFLISINPDHIFWQAALIQYMLPLRFQFYGFS